MEKNLGIFRRLIFLIVGGLSATVWSVPIDTTVVRLSLPDTVLRVGILSDAQFPENDELLSLGHFPVVMNGPKHILRALNYFKQEKVNLMIFNGDMVNAANGENAYLTYNKLLNYVFGKDKNDWPLLIYPMGNHEFYGHDAEAVFERHVGLPLNTHYVLNGIHFISVSCSDSRGGYSPQRLEYLRKHLVMADCEKGDRPIVVISHMPFDVDGFCGGKWDSPQSEEMYRILSDYPQIVYLSGHSHYPIFDEKSFLQRDFTMVNTGSTSYFDLDWNEKNGRLDMNQPNEYLNPHLIGIFSQADIVGRDEVNHGWIMTIDSRDGKSTLQRVDYNLQRPFGRPIVLSTYEKESFRYTNEGWHRMAAVPFFGRSTTVEVFVSEQHEVDICFDAADNRVLVKQYEMEIEGPDHKVHKIRFLARGYYGGWDLPYKEYVRYRACTSKGKYELRIRAVSCQGKKSEWISTTFTVT